MRVRISPRRHVTCQFLRHTSSSQKSQVLTCSRPGRSFTLVWNLFTGIVQGKARVKSIHRKTQDALTLRTFEIQFPKESTDIETVKIGASIALNGTCLTVTGTCVEDASATFDVIEETLRRTNLGNLEENSSVNFERSARVGDEIGGHTVSGHVQTTAAVTKVTTADDGTVKMDFELEDPLWMKYVLPKGFVAVDGCSLTVGEVHDTGFCVYLIPETLRVTVLGDKEVGDHVNIEVEAQTQAIVDTVERVVARYMVDDSTL